MENILNELLAENWFTQAMVAVKVAIAMVLGGVLGWDRDQANKPAGLRTLAITAGAAALLVGISDYLIHYFSLETNPSILRTDPVRVVEAVVTGVSFLGAGTIFRHSGKNVVEGITTAASLLLVASIGIAVGLGQLLLAVLVTGLGLLALRVVGRKRSPEQQQQED